MFSVIFQDTDNLFFFPFSQDGGNFDICTQQEVASGECLDNWSGTLVCPDLNGNLYAVGIYHSGPSSDCEAFGTVSNIPEEFVSIGKTMFQLKLPSLDGDRQNIQLVPCVFNTFLSPYGPSK